MVFMKKQKAIELLGGSVATVAEAVGISYQAVRQWPEELPSRIEDRVMAAVARKRLPDLLDTSPKRRLRAEAKEV